MPELPEVETTVRGLARYLDGAKIARVALNRPDLRRPFPPGLVQTLTGATVTGLGRRAKYGLIHTDRDQTMVFHLGMSGRWRIEPERAEKHDHLVLETGAGHVLALNDARRFGSVDLIDTAALEQWPPFAALGPEPLGDNLTPRHLHQAFKDRVAPVKPLLLDQRIVAGLGNIYVCEALYRAGIRPDKEAGKISRPALERLVPAIKTVLAESIEAGGSTIRDYAQPNGELGYFAASWRVYGREGEACDCGGTVTRFNQGGRSTFWCAKCQK
ncbi:bifunctional DNA-formamidopyrimidine glycosylase/DNA-(apurinic or apyrimidinic site) lyase [Novosphingobium sp. JCM 18896]|uniref:bifunctional DNA-formamidopyrimidine glycosylase/DNA-(apurinic or apyrimidinic site) lyase n=1 Tax=Novosphingobium sp. JCM 18896 TaxID=2989731 RepID=UPI002221E270|nr:bifunctional DNA-formamidopyrimidine glycosylase/DNA-(apurinic or apyrimidinic site) lyase [Novosphingobium sp. JCM 18896]MCW1428773.1 bifunctional DNA-formamidopyrimidine glycosylase/DNA-(apurinic or apyrimidinic site) lyase [Novosphingobium sp. JCM 18896]